MKLNNIALVFLLCFCCPCSFYFISSDNALTGITELGIPILDPFPLTNVHASISGHLDLTLVEGQTTGIHKCKAIKCVSNILEMYQEQEIVCEKIVISGHYKLISSSILQKTFGDIYGDGTLKVTLDNWHFKFWFPVTFVRRDEHSIYLNAMFDKALNESSVGKVTIKASGIKLGDTDISKSVNNLLNDNWKLIMASDIGNFANERSAAFYYSMINKFYENVPFVGLPMGPCEKIYE